MDAVRSMLDELMGKERDVPLAQRQNRQLEFDDPDVCKYELVALCPNRLFRNTKSDLGSCGYTIHDDHLQWAAVKERWDQLPQREKDRYPFERDLLLYMEQLIRDMDAKIRRNKDRANAESRPKVLKQEDQQRLDAIKAQQAELVAQATALGEAGDVDGALGATQQAEVLDKQHQALLKALTEPERTMAVCDICGVFMNSTDNEARRLEHLTGKQYLGWKKIRETYAELINARDTRHAPGCAAAPHDGHPRNGGRSRSRSGREEGERRRHRSGSRHRRSSSRDRDRDRRRSRSRDRDRDRRRSRSRDRARGGSYHRDRDHRHPRSGSYDRR